MSCAFMRIHKDDYAQSMRVIALTGVESDRNDRFVDTLEIELLRSITDHCTSASELFPIVTSGFQLE